MKVLKGFIAGLLFVLVLGAVAKNEIQEHFVTVKGDIVSPTIKYQSTFSSVTPDGDCYLAITNTMTGRTEMFRITNSTGQMFDERAFVKGRDGRVVATYSSY